MTRKIDYQTALRLAEKHSTLKPEDLISKIEEDLGRLLSRRERSLVESAYRKVRHQNMMRAAENNTDAEAVAFLTHTLSLYLTFDKIPTNDMRNWMKRYGFRWNPYDRRWWTYAPLFEKKGGRLSDAPFNIKALKLNFEPKKSTGRNSLQR